MTCYSAGALLLHPEIDEDDNVSTARVTMPPSLRLAPMQTAARRSAGAPRATDRGNKDNPVHNWAASVAVCMN